MEPLLVVVLILALGLLLAVGGIVLSRRSRVEVEEAPPAPLAPSAAEPVGEATAAPVEAEAPPVEAPAEAPVEAAPVRPRLRDRLGRTRATFAGLLSLRGRGLDDGVWDDVEDTLLLADVGMPTTQRILDDLRQAAKEDRIATPDALLARLRADLAEALDARSEQRGLRRDGPAVWLFVGVNGVGKTTTIAKLAQQQAAEGARVLLAAADTFRAAAADQLGEWARRVGAELVRGQEGADPGSVVYDAMSAAAARDVDLVLVDTAGRLHTKTNLMEELKKLKRIVDRTPGALQEVLLVIDATTGQNGLAQARQFADAVDVTGVVLTKLDGTAKGGIVLAIEAELGIPVKVVGVGEGPGDLVTFDPAEFVAALFE